jgi:glycosyltransferase involved in cell wall biosynthesis
MPQQNAAVVWLDVTTLFSFKGRATGIPRTVAALCQEWCQRQFANLRFCRLNFETRSYLEIPREQVLAKLLSLSAATPVENPPPAPCNPEPGSDVPPTLEQRLKDYLRRRVKPYIPQPVRAPLKKQAMAGLRLARKILRAGKRLATMAVPRPAPDAVALPQSPALPLGPNDVVVCPGSGWEVQDGSEICWKLKKEMGFRMVFLLYDAIPIKFPHFYGPGFAAYYARWFTNTLWTADLVVTISEHSRKDFRAFAEEHSIPCPPIEVVRLGENLYHSAATEGQVPQVMDAPFVLSVGTLEIRKNHVLLCHVWRRLIERHGAENVPRLVLVGAPGWAINDLVYLLESDPLARSHITVLKGMTDAQLYALYQNCLFTLYPSHYEGWGLPISESLAFGKCCVCSNSSSMPEIGGDLVAQHDPLDGRRCLELVEQLLFDPAYRNYCEERIRRHYQRTSWGDCARQFQRLMETHLGDVFDDKEDVGANSTNRDVSHPAADARRAA